MKNYEIKKIEMDEFVKEMGFENEKDFHSLMACVDISTPTNMQRFLNWKENDGTKDGLLKVIALNKPA